MEAWNASHYLKYGDQRTRAAIDLSVRIQLESPQTVVDLGCGPGNSTQILHRRWPGADVLGIDNSATMIAAARQSYPSQNWQQADIVSWNPDQPYDLVFSNAALQWIPNHEHLIPRVFSIVGPGGALAFQVPSRTFARVRELVHEVSHNPKWDDRMQAARSSLTMERPSFYYDRLAGPGVTLDIWETDYLHVMESPQAIIDWMSSTGLRPFFAALDGEQERGEFLAELNRLVTESYETRPDGKVLFPFCRTFVIAYQKNRK